MNDETRRSFNGKLLGSLMAYGLIETLFDRDLFADAVKPVISKWLVDLHELSKDPQGPEAQGPRLPGQARRPLQAAWTWRNWSPSSISTAWADGEVPRQRGGQPGRRSERRSRGCPKRLVFGKQIFAMRKGRSVVPHGHDNMCTGFIVLRGDFSGRHYDRVEDDKDHYLIRPTIDRPLQAGRVLDHLRPQGQRPLVQGGVGDGFHLQRPRPRLQPGQQQAARPGLRRSGGREVAGRPDRGEEDLQREVPQEVRLAHRAIRVPSARGSERLVHQMVSDSRGRFKSFGLAQGSADDPSAAPQSKRRYFSLSATDPIVLPAVRLASAGE